MSGLRLRATGSLASASPQKIDEVEVRRALSILASPESGCQLFFVPSKRKDHRQGSDLDGLVQAVKDHASQDHIYVVLNPLPVDFDDYRNNAAILKRVWLFIDIDPIKPAAHQKNPSSDAEHEQTRQAAEQLREYLAGLGWPAPVQIDSGNGWYLLYRVDLENSDAIAALVKRFLEAMQAVIGSKGKIDLGVRDAARIARVPGTWNRKGQQSDDRPWRPCRLVSFPKGSELVSRAMIEAAVGPDVAKNGHAPAKKKKSSLVLKAGSPGANAYVKKAMELEASAVAGAAKGERNSRLNKAAYSLAGYIGTGYLSQGEIEARMFEAARESGLDKDDGGEPAIWATIKSGVNAGIKKPRMVFENEPYRSIEPEASPDVPAAWELCLDEESIAAGDAESILEPLDGLDDEGSRAVFQIYTLPVLMEKQFPPPAWVVPGLLSEGLNILAGKPKMGKSILALNLAMTISGGGLALGNTPVEQGDVLYLALEDKFRRIQARARKMSQMTGHTVSKHLSLATSWPRCDAGGLHFLEKWIGRVGQPRLIIIDVWPMFKPAAKQGSRKSAYDEDYEAFGNLKKFCDKRNVNCLVLLHCRKGLSEDVLDEVSGTLGQVGASDGIIVLNRSRSDGDARIFVCGRDVEEQELALSFDLPTLTWKSQGSIKDFVDGELQKAIVEYLKIQRSAFNKDIAIALSKGEESVRKALSKLVERKLVRRSGNRYEWPGEGERGEDEGVI